MEEESSHSIKLMNFVSEQQLDEAKRTRGDRIEDGTAQKDRPLYEGHPKLWMKTNLSFLISWRRFHGLSEFDEKKRSCRHRLSDHNARRRKPQTEAVRFSAARPSSAEYGTGFIFE